MKPLWSQGIVVPTDLGISYCHNVVVKEIFTSYANHVVLSYLSLIHSQDLSAACHVFVDEVNIV